MTWSTCDLGNRWPGQ